MVTDATKKGIACIVAGLAGYLTGVSLENETMRNIMGYITDPQYTEYMAQYAAPAKFVSACAVLGAVARLGYNALFDKKEQPGPGPYGPY